MLQLYGICHSPPLTALVFHGVPYFMNQRDYYKSLPSSQWMTHYLKLHQQYEPAQSAHSMLEAHNLRGICRAFETNTFIKEHLLDYYELLFGMIYRVFHPHTSTLPSPLDKAAPFQLSHPEINLLVYSLPGWNKVVHEMDIDITVQKTGIVLTLLPNMTIQYMMRHYLQPGPAKQTTLSKIFLSTSWIYKLLRISELLENWIDFEGRAQSILDCKKDTESSAFNESLETKHLYWFCPWKCMGKIYWSQDEQGQHVIEDSSIQSAFGITVDCNWETYAVLIPSHFYQILHTIHESCGFDPYSTEVAEYLGLPVAVIDSGRSGLEEFIEISMEQRPASFDGVSPKPPRKRRLPGLPAPEGRQACSEPISRIGGRRHVHR
ncbi:hypothetical protein C8J56DRAFT_890448 [Mycena floridula]|nr:hypothetical protein C8J56DRAFT_890448 [Mycena floridula]